MYAVIEMSGTQYKVKEGDRFEVFNIDKEPGSKVENDKVLLISDENGNVEIGKPYLENKKVVLSVDRNTQGEKIRVFKYKKRKKYRKTQGHRDKLTILRVEKIV